MPLLKVQLNHPGKEKNFRLGKGYQIEGNLIIREWNNELKHYRKFIRCEGQYLTDVKSKPLRAPLYFWGEWEGHSIFTPLKSENPNGIHEPFRSLENVGRMNTDPYVYGTDFKYATCMQTGKLKDLSPDSLVFFGTTTAKGFELDTVFVVKSYETAESVFNTSAAAYSDTYKEQTLTRLGETYLSPKYSAYKRIYRSITWWDNPNYFSFVPCRLEHQKNPFKVVLPIPPFSRQKVGHPLSHLERWNHFSLWTWVVEEVIRQNFFLAISFKEPSLH
jgi:hypothetical protein